MPGRTAPTLALLVLAAAQTAEAKMGRCLLEVDNRPYLLGRCNIDSEADGSFSIGTGGKGVGSAFFAYINSDSDRTAVGHWNETKDSTHAHSELGTLKRFGACWINEKAKVCAWK